MIPWRTAIVAFLACLAGCGADPDTAPTEALRDPRNADYFISGERVDLVDGVSVVETDAGARTTRYFGNAIRTDIDADGRDDTVFMLTRQTANGPMRFFVAAALDRPAGIVGSQAVLIGESIAPQPMHVDGAGLIVVNFAERAPRDAASAAPSHGRSLWLRFDPADLSFGEVVQDFPGEADPARMQLGMKRWRTVRITREDGMEKPIDGNATITLELNDDGTFSATSGCATLTGRTHRVPGRGSGAIAFLDIASAPHDCDDAPAQDYRRMLAAVAAYRFTGRGELILSSSDGKQRLTFR